MYKNGINIKENDGQQYGWSQTTKELTIYVEFSPPLKSISEIAVEITSQSISVRRKTAPEGEYILKGKLWKPIKVDESTWHVEDRKLLTIELMKLNRLEWWNCAIVGHKEVDTTKLQPEVSTDVSDLDSKTQELVNKMMFDNRQKAMGLPTSDELKKQEMLKKFAEQHPEFDFSKAKIQ
ncbi:nuclear migration protein nudC-like isoform X2 [Schistocerca gregaria]|nr:nuclear migration protein nudC-like isoform X2 [Schistocerca gregaria]